MSTSGLTAADPIDTATDTAVSEDQLTPENVEELTAQAAEHKAKGNNLFASGKFEEAIKAYEEALLTCPEVKVEERAVYWGNIGACHMRMESYKKAVHACSESLKLHSAYSKSLLRRAQANERLSTYSSLTDALEDYTALQKQDGLSEHTKIECAKAVRRLPPLIEQQKEKEKDEMMGNLKNIGNTLLGKFGLSTDNFRMQQDPATGSYNVNFVQNQSDK
jgi:tetratricopeptide (TPR) repeat protein